MKHISFYVDFLSPYAYLAFEKLPEALKGISYSVTYKPLLFAGLLKHHGQLGPAEIAGKREWTYRQVLWLAHQHGITLQLPATHPFNPLPLLRLAVACDAHGTPNRYVCETLFRHVWCGGAEASDAQRLAALTAQLAPPREVNAADVKAQLQAHSDEAIAQGVFGVPAMVVDGQVFWGLDALPMLHAFLLGDAWFDGPDWSSACQLAPGITRQK
ncbi:2-hydroxychromene-2-carboxylate isomerase [Polaromonas sp. SM01]|uniref:2-hydroxychromene-2-carboxylate isomerase n=1 Tax=Polaromonas sp. SM01 TaxID=3085630 RepID=UPI002982A50B|nr:2-hydroxychromene-2-carboxylate isomerase [Polaromonas sp. SM01]MDW5445124.1 2-hydroxychromene-2-carboxylate isomerase [Polaromonas sp. SM01]